MAEEAQDLHFQGAAWLPSWRGKKNSGCPTWRTR
uniref:Uncharacterized protein n=1 Tax=Suricata suricatta TaxID=37032 RepID=A0A673UVJ5_SURSU